MVCTVTLLGGGGLVDLQVLAWLCGCYVEEEVAAFLYSRLGLQQIGGFAIGVEDHATRSEPQG